VRPSKGARANHSTSLSPGEGEGEKGREGRGSFPLPSNVVAITGNWGSLVPLLYFLSKREKHPRRSPTGKGKRGKVLRRKKRNQCWHVKRNDQVQRKEKTRGAPWKVFGEHHLILGESCPRPAEKERGVEHALDTKKRNTDASAGSLGGRPGRAGCEGWKKREISQRREHPATARAKTCLRPASKKGGEGAFVPK